MNRVNKFTVSLLSLLISFSFFVTVSASSKNNESVSDMELLLFSGLCYANPDDNHSNVLNKDDFKRLQTSQAFTSLLGPYVKDSDKVFSKLNNWEIVSSVINKSNKSMAGFSAYTYKKGDCIVIAFRGTDGGIFRENWRYLIPFVQHPQIKYVKQYVDYIANCNFINQNTKIYVTGHSLGGYLAIHSVHYILHDSRLKDKFIKCDTFNSLGMRKTDNKDVLKTLSSLNDKQMVNFQIRGDVVSKLGRHYSHTQVVSPAGKSAGGNFSKARCIHMLFQFFPLFFTT